MRLEQRTPGFEPPAAREPIRRDTFGERNTIACVWQILGDHHDGKRVPEFFPQAPVRVLAPGWFKTRCLVEKCVLSGDL